MTVAVGVHSVAVCPDPESPFSVGDYGPYDRGADVDFRDLARALVQPEKTVAVGPHPEIVSLFAEGLDIVLVPELVIDEDLRLR